jgi:chromosomal replication initiation ATPase DnaA
MKAEIYVGLPIYEQKIFIKSIDNNILLSKNKDRAKIILKSILKIFTTSEEQIKSKNRHQKIVLARQFYCYFLRNHTILSSIAIGELIERDHATVLHSVSKIENTLNYKDIMYYHDLIMEQIAKS